MKSHQAGPVRVHFVPYWPANPYQPLLVDALRGLGLEVATDTPLKSLVTAVDRNGAGGNLVHLHWLPVASPGARRMVRWWLFARRVFRLTRRGVPVVWTAHNVVPHESELTVLDLWMSRTVANHAARIICHSDAARAELVSRLRIADESRIEIIPHGHYIDAYPNVLSRHECRARLGLPAGATVLLAFGAIRPYKGVLELIDAFRRLRERAVRLLVVGKPHGAAIDAAVRARIGPDFRVAYFPGHVASEDLQLYFNAADAAVFPYRNSLTSGALVLAMSFGRACVAPRLPGMADCLGEQGGFLYDAHRQGGLCDALSQLVAQRGRLDAMGALNLERARVWDWRAIGARTAECYLQAVDLAKSASTTLQPIEAG
jgi:beta-1,4-mannosyltransferase